MARIKHSFDFVRCQRPDGTFYGTSGQCRKGREVDTKATNPLAGLNLGKKGPPKQGSKKIGEGAFGAAYDLGNGVIIKKGQFKQGEVDAMAALKHIPGIPKLLAYKYDTKSDVSVPIGPRTLRQGVIAMSKVPGKPVTKIESDRGRGEAWQRILPILKKVHQAGFVHGDLHNSNVMYDRKSKVASIIDFGLAQKATGLRRDRQFDEIFHLVKYQLPVRQSPAYKKLPVLKSFADKAQTIEKQVSKMSIEEVAGPKGEKLLKELWDTVPDV